MLQVKVVLMKAVGLNIIMAQAGFFVAASEFTSSLSEINDKNFKCR